MHVSPVKHSYAWLTKSVTTWQTDRHMDRLTYRQTPDKVIPMCFIGDTKTQMETLQLEIWFSVQWNTCGASKITAWQSRTDRWTTDKVIFCFASATKILFFYTWIYTHHLWGCLSNPFVDRLSWPQYTVCSNLFPLHIPPESEIKTWVENVNFKIYVCTKHYASSSEKLIVKVTRSFILSCHLNRFKLWTMCIKIVNTYISRSQFMAKRLKRPINDGKHWQDKIYLST